MRSSSSFRKQLFTRRATSVVAVLLICVVLTRPNVSSTALNSLIKLLNASGPEPEVIAFRDRPNKNPIVFIPGDGGNQLEAKLNKTKVPHYLCYKVSDWFDLWLNIHLLAPGAIDCLFDNFKLVYDNKTRTTHNTQGVQIRATNFGSLESVDYLDVYRLPQTDYYNNIIKTLIRKNGYVYNVDMVAAGFDWRKAPNELADYFEQLKRLIEKHYVNNNYKPVTLICHSMGCLNSLYLLNRQTENWRELYVRRLIALAAPWSGSFKAMTAMLYGDNLGIPFLNKYKLQALQSTFPSLMYLFPREPAFHRKQTLIETAAKNYTLASLEQLFVDANLLDQREIWLDTKAVAGNLTAPNVELWCLYGTGSATPEKVIFEGSLNKDKYVEVQGEGDGTVNLDSLKACEGFASQQERPVYTKMFRNVDHIGILKGPEAANFISTQILNEELR